MKATIWHNPACGTSRKTLEILEASRRRRDGHRISQVAATTRAKLEQPATATPASPRRDGLRTRGTDAEELGLAEADDEAILDAMVANPTYATGRWSRPTRASACAARRTSSAKSCKAGGVSEPLDPRILLLRGYAAGIFPMADSRDAGRGVLGRAARAGRSSRCTASTCSRSLARTIRARARSTSPATAPSPRSSAPAPTATRPGSTPISSAPRSASTPPAMPIRSNAGQDGELAGGLYGVRLGRAFFGESMFSRATDASKVALAWLVARLRVGHFLLLDCQFMTDHLASLGAVAVAARRYVGVAVGARSASARAAVRASAPPRSRNSTARSPTSLPPPEFGALDRLLEVRAPTAGRSGAAGQLIAQLLGHTS